MPIFTELNREVGPRTAEDFPVSFGEAISARFASAFNREGTSSTIRFFEREEAGPGGVRRSSALGLRGAIQNIMTARSPFTGFFEGVVESNQLPQIRETISAEEANEAAGHLGLKFDKPIPIGQFELIVRQKRKELAWQSIRRRESSTFGLKAVGLATDLFATAVDPLNLASSFVPVVGQARFLNVAAKIGVGKARLARGAIEGFVGNLAVEPVIAFNASQEQADYQLTDSLLNLAFGTVVGGGLHITGGKIGDVVRGRTPLEPPPFRRRPQDFLTPEEKRLVRGDGEPTVRKKAGPEVTNAQRVESLDVEQRADVQRAAITDAVEGRDIDIEPAFREERTSVDEIQRKQADPDNVRLADRQASEEAERLSVEKVKKETPDEVQMALDEDIAVFEASMKQLAEDETGAKVLEDAGVRIDKEGKVQFDALSKADEEIAKTDKLGRAIELAAECINRNA